jgi:hypothetical protein
MVSDLLVYGRERRNLRRQEGMTDMFGANWNDPQTLWLNLTNLALGLITLTALLVVAGAVAWELVLKRRKAHEFGRMDADMRTLLGGSPHVLGVPELGLTMADGGEPIQPSEKTTRKDQTGK